MIWSIAGTLAVLAVVLFPHGAESHAGPVFTGRFEQETMPVIAKTGGRVREVCAREGDAVDAGRTLVRLDDSELQARYRSLKTLADRAAAGTDLMASLEDAPAAAKAQLIELNPAVQAAENDYLAALAAYDKARAEGGDARVAQERLEAAGRRRTETRVRVSRQVGRFLASSDTVSAEVREAVKLLEEQLAQSAIVSPADGSVDILQLHPGDIVLPGQPVAAVAVRGHYSVTLHVTEAQLAGMHEGRSVEVTVGGIRPSCAGKVERIARDTADEEDEAGFAVRIRIDTPPEGARAGMHAKVRLP